MEAYQKSWTVENKVKNYRFANVAANVGTGQWNSNGIQYRDFQSITFYQWPAHGLRENIALRTNANNFKSKRMYVRTYVYIARNSPLRIYLQIQKSVWAFCFVSVLPWIKVQYQYHAHKSQTQRRMFKGSKWKLFYLLWVFSPWFVVVL